MLQPVQQKPFRTNGELFASDYKIQNTFQLEQTYQDYPWYQRGLKERRVIEFTGSDQSDWAEETVKHQIVRLQPCAYLKNFIDNGGDRKSYKGIYLIREIAATSPRNLFVPPFHPYQEKFQQLMDWSFEAGLLPKAWEMFFYEIFNSIIELKRIENKDEETVLDFAAIGPFFLVLVFGFLFALLALLCEIFYHDFVRQISKDLFKNFYEKIFNRKTKVRKVRN